MAHILSLMLFSLNKDSNNRLDELRSDLVLLDRVQVGLGVAAKIGDSQVKDHAITELLGDLKPSSRGRVGRRVHKLSDLPKIFGKTGSDRSEVEKEEPVIIEDDPIATLLESRKAARKRRKKDASD